MRRGTLDIGAAVALALGVAAGVAHAEPAAPSMPEFASSEPEPAAPMTSRSTYRTSIAIASGAGLAMLLAVPPTERPAPGVSDTLFLTGMATSMLAPLVVHGLHGEAERGFASAGTRVAGFAAGMLAGRELGACDSVIYCDDAYPSMSASSTGGQVGLAGVF